MKILRRKVFIDDKIDKFVREYGVGKVANKLGVTQPYLTHCLKKNRPLPYKYYLEIKEIQNGS